ncbi:hypothetical protein BKA62DRAFT_501927 [Auriculariales sp. MPI-PUGE-AT-0066]|nr:hypothetical protein BKA62DRAFT_501927 [Auriculariales sp. MPI-PUGE-AT-0066]
MALSIIDEALGTILIGSWLNVALFGLETIMVLSYFKRFRHDRLWLRCLVVAMYLGSIASVTVLCCMMYLYCVTNFGNVSYVLKLDVTWPITICIMSWSVLFLHGFLLYRFARLSRNWPVTIFLALCAAAQPAAGINLAYAMTRLTSVFDRPKFRNHLIVWMTASAGSDVLIGSALIWKLLSVKTMFKQTKSLIWRLIGTAIMSGAITALLAILGLTSYMVKPQANYCLMISILIGRVSTMTVIYNLNERADASDSMVCTDPTSPDFTMAVPGTSMPSAVWTRTRRGGFRSSSPPLSPTKAINLVDLDVGVTEGATRDTPSPQPSGSGSRRGESKFIAPWA